MVVTCFSPYGVRSPNMEEALAKRRVPIGTEGSRIGVDVAYLGFGTAAFGGLSVLGLIMAVFGGRFGRAFQHGSSALQCVPSWCIKSGYKWKEEVEFAVWCFVF